MTTRRTIVSVLAGAVASLGLRTTRAQGEGGGNVRAIPTSKECHRPLGVRLKDIFPDEVCDPGTVRTQLDSQGGGTIGLYYHDTDCCVYYLPCEVICRGV